ncbi:unnamed protein product, partial [Mesorhabditis belari]|uniref:Uncharacterized protein n=1 Tax=Mesorhabditis belari TaxID=2138241 RepID=A0AAF3E8Q8_9BILA
MKRRVPCKQDCDQRIYPHCTDECKCDYAYPSVQKFCNPPPLPLFLQTCRIWYNQCPKYEQYHYASQYIYSKAEKGKVLPGIVPKPVNPYNIPQPGPAVSAPLGRSRVRAAASRSLAPRYEEETRKVASTEPRRHSALADAIEMSKKEDQPITKTRDLSTFRRVLYNMYRQKDDTTSEHPRSEALIVPPDISDNFKRKRTAKASQGSIPIIPSEAAYGSGDAFKDFDAFTDSRGVAHRPRSRSPWSKPGLWEPNPDDPHNRDHANKYYYHPESVTADWVNGQLAWGAHWAVPAAGTGGSDGYSVAHFPSLGHFLNIPDDYD